MHRTVKKLRFLPSGDYRRYTPLFKQLACTAMTWKP